VEAGAASACGVGRAKARDRAGNQNYCEKCLHVPSVLFRRRAAPDLDSNCPIPQRRDLRQFEALMMAV
jgi:hypothetical protein